MLTNQLKNSHLLWRAGFGPSAAQLPQLNELTPSQLFKGLQQKAASTPVLLDATDDNLKGLFNSLQAEGLRPLQNREELRSIQRQALRAVRELNLLWLDEMVQSESQFREKMAFFWHDHFASRNQNVFYQQQMLHVIRQHALGSFRTLLHDVSKSAAMLNFLNAKQNRKGHPNENFAREVMELFTIGRGHYSETDVKEAARAFTGWNANLQGEFVFRRFQHDAGTKTVLGKTGNFSGENILDMLLEKKETARFLTQKIYRFFVNETLDKEKAGWLAGRFYGSDYNIGQLMEDIFTSDWFYEAKNIGTRIKSPIELLAGIRRMLPMEIENNEAQLLVQRLLGQMLFYPPNVAGWPGGKSWIDSSSLMLRMRLPQLIVESDELNVQPKTDDDQMMGRMEEMKIPASSKKSISIAGKQIRAAVNWNAYTKNFASVARENLVEAVTSSLLQTKPSFNLALIKQYANNSSREAFVKTATLQLMSTPDYQLC